MKNRHSAPTATSLPQAPEAQAASRLKRYGITMAIRTACFLLMAFITPYGWYTWVFAAAAIVLPYVAVVFANAGEDETSTPQAESALTSITERADEPERETAAPTVIQLRESPRAVPTTDDAATDEAAP